MRTRVLMGVAAACLLMMGSHAGAQGVAAQGVGGLSDEQMQMVQEMQGNFQQIMANMQAKGIDPQEFGQQMFQGIQDGTLDPADIQQMLIDKGVMDQGMVTKMQSATQKLALSVIKTRLGSTDEEWAVLLPKMQRLVAASSEVGQMGQGGGGLGGMAMMQSMGQSTGPTAKAWKELKVSMKDKQLLDPQLAIKLREWRAAHNKAKVELEAAQEDLRKVLTLRQEALLMDMGMIN